MTTPAPSISYPPKSRRQFEAVLATWLATSGVVPGGRVLALGASAEDGASLAAVGFDDITLSQHQAAAGSGMLAIDAEAIDLPAGAYDVVFAHEVLHHCRSPHPAVCEMLRVARRHVLFQEPNDSLLMRLLIRLRLSFPYEIGAVVGHGYAHGGVRNSAIPNYVFRWSAHELEKLVAAFMPEREVTLHADPYWDFNIHANELGLRRETRLGALTAIIGAERFLALLHMSQPIANRIGFLRAQGNKFFCAISPTATLRPWLVKEEDGRIAFNRAFRA